jgi:DNA polymerase-3 subunit chi
VNGAPQRMPRADFYLIAKPRFRDDPLLLVCELAKRAFESGQPTLILARSADQADALDEKLWEFDEQAFVPHQIAGDDDDAITPVLIAPPGAATADRTLVINLRDECAPGLFERVLEVVPADEAERLGSRERWKTYKAAGFEVNKHDM